MRSAMVSYRSSFVLLLGFISVSFRIFAGAYFKGRFEHRLTALCLRIARRQDWRSSVWRDELRTKKAIRSHSMEQVLT